jgi:Transposase DDE domain group 1
VQNTARRTKITVSADGTGLVPQAGTLLLAETLRVTGLGGGLSGGLARWRAPRAVHDPGKILTDLAMALALGGDCLADVAVLRAQPELAGPVASDPVVSRLVGALAAEGRGRCGLSAKPAPLPGSGPGRWPASAHRARTGR